MGNIMDYLDWRRTGWSRRECGRASAVPAPAPSCRQGRKPRKGCPPAWRLPAP